MKLLVFLKKYICGKCIICKKDLSWGDVHRCKACGEKCDIQFGETVQSFQGPYKGAVGQVVSPNPTEFDKVAALSLKVKVRILMPQIENEERSYREIKDARANWLRKE